MLNSANARSSTISSIIAAPHNLSQAGQNNNNPSITMTTAPLSAAAIKISRDNRLFEHLMPKVDKNDRMTLLSWFLEEEKLKDYESFKQEFYEDPDEYNYALSSLLGTLVFDVTPVTPNAGTIGTFVGPNLNRRNVLLPFQSALTEKWKAIGPAFQHSWLNAMDKTQREALIMRSFIDTANINEEMTNARRQSFDLRTSELSGRGLISFIQEHCLQAAAAQNGSIPVSLPHTDNMVRIFKAWVEKSGIPPDDENSNDTLFKRSCALSLRDKCIYSRALFATRLCLTVLEKWENIIRTVEMKQGSSSKTKPSNIEYGSVTTTAEVDPNLKQPKPKKKKKGKASKKMRRTGDGSDETQTAAAETKVGEEIDDISRDEVHNVTGAGLYELAGEEVYEVAAASGSDESKSSGVCSPTGSAGDDSKLMPSSGVELESSNIKSSSEVKPALVEPEISQHTISMRANGIVETEEDEDLQKNFVRDEQLKVNGVTPDDNTTRAIDAEDDEREVTQKGTQASREMNKESSQTSEAETAEISQETATDFQRDDQNSTAQVRESDINSSPWEQISEQQDADWLPVTGKRRKTQTADKNRNGMHNRQVVKRSTSDRRQHSGITSTARAPVNNRFPGKVTPLQPPQTSRPQSLPAQSFNIGQQQYMQLADSSSTNAASVEGENDSSVDSLTTSSPMGQMAKSLVLSDSDIPLESAERIAPSDTVTISEPIAHRKDSLAESEATEISIAQGKPRKAKAHRKRTKPAEFISTEQISDGQQVLLKGNSVDLPEPLNLETVIFFCAVCRRPRSSHHSVQCPLCGPNSTIRYCTTSCQRQDTEHWRLCGLTPFKVLITIQGKLTQSENRVSSWMTPALARQRMLLAEQTKVDYLLFSPNVYSPKYSLVLADEGMKLRFSKLREQLFQRHSLKTVVLLYRIIMSEVEVQSLAFTKEDLANQLFSEFGVNPLSTPKGKDLQITPNDWIDAGIV